MKLHIKNDEVNSLEQFIQFLFNIIEDLCIAHRVEHVLFRLAKDNSISFFDATL